MAFSVTFHYLGPPEQKHVAKLGPMAPLRSALAEGAAKWRPALDLATAQVLLNKKPVDLDTPFRLLNIPSGSRLDVVRGAAAAAAAPTQTGPAAAATTAAAVAAAAAPPAVAAPAAAAHSTAPAPVSSTNTAAANQVPSSGAPAAVDPALAALGVAVPIAVFNQRAVEAAAAARGTSAPSSADPGDDFFEFTADDFAEVARAAQRRAAAESVLMTRTAREAQARARAEALPPVPVRLHFPDSSIVQAEFAATQPVSAIMALARAVVPAPLSPALYLYTTPPKAVLKDAAATLFDLRLFPAAHIHVGVDTTKLPGGAAWEGAWLRPEVVARMADEVPDPLAGRVKATEGPVGAGGSRDDAAAARERERAIAEARRRAAASAASSGAAGDGEKKVPKWLKR